MLLIIYLFIYLLIAFAFVKESFFQNSTKLLRFFLTSIVDQESYTTIKAANFVQQCLNILELFITNITQVVI